MPKSAASSSDPPAPNLWERAYKALREDEKGKERLDKLNDVLREQLGMPKLRIRSQDGYKQLQAMIKKKAQVYEAKRLSNKLDIVSENMLKLQDLVSAGANVGGPYIAIPAAGLFLVFSVHQIYQTERRNMLELAEVISHYVVLHDTADDRVRILPEDDSKTRELKRNFHLLHIGLFKSILFATAQLTISLYGDMQFIKNIFNYYDWAGQLAEIERNHKLCNEYRDEWIARQNDPTSAQPTQTQVMGPAPRNPLHWAVSFSVPEQVTHLVQSKEYPINALTPQSWTAAHLAARQGNVAILKTILTAPGINLRIKNKDGSTPLHIAAFHGKVWATKLISQRDRKLLPLRDNKGKTAFLIAAVRGHVKVLEVLKNEGQNLNEATLKNGWTALHMAADEGHTEAVKFLLDNGADKSIKTKDGNWKGFDARKIAEKRKRLEIVALLS